MSGVACYTLTVLGKPTGKGRPRFSRGGHAYTPDTTRAYEASVQLAFAQSNPKALPLEGGVRIEIDAYYAIPKSASKARRALMAANRLHVVVKPDWDNIGKIICDALNGVAWRDDAQIVCATVRKRYGASPMVTVRILESKEGETTCDICNPLDPLKPAKLS